MISQLPLQFYGKLHFASDFITFGDYIPEKNAIDEWLQKGIKLSKNRIQKSDDEVFIKSNHALFVFVKNEKIVAGIISPSSDSFGREYPFLSIFQFKEIDKFEEKISILPFILDQQFSILQNFLNDIFTLTEKSSLKTRLANFKLTFSGDLHIKEDLHLKYLSETTIKDFWIATLGQNYNSCKYLVIYNLITTFLYLKDKTYNQIPTGLRFPLPTEHKFISNIASYWLQLCIQFSKEKNFQLKFFLTQDDINTKSYMYVFFYDPPPRIYSSLLYPEIDDDNICKVDQDGDLMNAKEKLLQNFGNLIQNDTLSLINFLEYFSKN